MSYRLLLSGHKPTFELFSFDPSSSSARSDTTDGGTNAGKLKLKRLSTPAAPPSCTWLERSPVVPNVVYGSSETEHEVYSMVVERNDVRITSKRGTGCTWPVHLAVERDGSGLLTGGLGSGETVYFPLERYGTFSQSPTSPHLLTCPDPWPYTSPEGINPSPFGKRQKGPHVHGLEVDSKGTIYICDLGSDAIWIAEKDTRRVDEAASSRLKVVGKFQTERGCTPRHSVLSPDEVYLYVNSELQSRLLIFDTTSHALVSSTDLTPPHLSPSIRSLLLTAELYAHPRHKRTMYITFRGVPERVMGDMSPYRGIETPSEQSPSAAEKPVDKGDSIAVVLLSEDGSRVESVKHVITGLDWPRGMRVSDDGRYLAVAGEYGGGLEVYEIKGDRGERLELVEKDESVKDVNCVLWL